MTKKTTRPKTKGQDDLGPVTYERPSIRVFTEEEILSQLGPAQLYAGSMPFEF
ncbi:MAG: hypothetical protein PVF68_08450 [Acidobacteriota bacterium]|jgi:hypothetical protein